MMRGGRRLSIQCAAHRSRSTGCKSPERWLVIMVKAPMAGRVKTRLGRQIGTVAATAFYRHTTRSVIARLARDTRWHTMLAVAPDTAVASSFWPADVPRVPQGHGGLGERMQRLIDGMPPGPVLVMGTDIPSVRPHHIARAFRLLGQREAVFGPADDGGFWLTGQRRSPSVHAAFGNVRWSTEHALGDTLRNLDSGEVAFAATLSDVDTRTEYLSVRGHHGRIVVPAE